MTPTALKTAVLQELQVVSPDMPVENDQLAIVTSKYTGLHKQLLKRIPLTWAIGDNVPEECEDPMVMLLAAKCVEPFGIGEPRGSKIQAMGALFSDPMSPAEKQLRMALNDDYVSHPLESEYF